MIQNCKMRHENGNCLPTGGFCTANKNICEALQNAYEIGQRNAIRKKGEWKLRKNESKHQDWWACSECGGQFSYKWNFCPYCGADMRKEVEG